MLFSRGAFSFPLFSSILSTPIIMTNDICLIRYIDFIIFIYNFLPVIPRLFIIFFRVLL